MAKKILIFIAGIITGIVLTFLIALLTANGKTVDNGVTLFKKRGECISNNSFEIIQVFNSGNALAIEIDPDTGFSLVNGITVLFLCDGTNSYYDSQIIETPSGKCVKQIGVFKYTSAYTGMNKTVPIVEICNK